LKKWTEIAMIGLKFSFLIILKQFVTPENTIDVNYSDGQDM